MNLVYEILHAKVNHFKIFNLGITLSIRIENVISPVENRCQSIKMLHLQTRFSQK